MKKLVLLFALSLVLSCQAAKTALDVADEICKVVNVLDPDSGKTIGTVIDIADVACKFVQIAYTDEGGKQQVMMLPKELVKREALAYRRTMQHDAGAPTE